MVSPRTTRATVSGDGRGGNLFDFEPPEWMARADCKGFPEYDWIDEQNKANKRACLEICGVCGVRRECLAYAIGDPSLVGVWGGADTAARRGMRKLLAPTRPLPAPVTREPTPEAEDWSTW